MMQGGQTSPTEENPVDVQLQGPKPPGSIRRCRPASPSARASTCKAAAQQQKRSRRTEVRLGTGRSFSHSPRAGTSPREVFVFEIAHLSSCLEPWRYRVAKFISRKP